MPQFAVEFHPLAADDDGRAQIAYAESGVAVVRLFEEAGTTGVANLLGDLAARVPFGVAFERHAGMTYEAFQQLLTGPAEGQTGVRPRGLALFQSPELPALPLVGPDGRTAIERSRQPGDSSHLDLFLARFRRPVLVEGAGVGLRDMPLRETLDDNALLAAEGAGNHDLVAGPDLAVGLGRLAVDVNPADFAGFLGLGPGPEEAGDVEPDVEPLSLHAIIGGL
jgi:hypothetical protein